MDEIWKDIKGYEGLYQVSNLGRVKSLNREEILKNRWNGHNIRKLKGRILKPHLDGKGEYYQICLCKNGKPKNLLLHRIVAENFIHCENLKLDVNHKDGNKKNNCVDNLEFITRSENLKHALKLGLIKNQCKICRIVTLEKDNVSIKFESMKDCATYFGFKKGWLQNRIRKHGLSFEYKGYLITVSKRGDV